MLTKDAIHAAIAAWPSRYETKDGEVVHAQTVSGIAASLRDIGWRKVPRLDEYDLRQLGVRVVQAQYIGGARATGRFVAVAVLPR